MIGVGFILVVCLGFGLALAALIVGSVAHSRAAEWKADRDRQWIRDQLSHALRDIEDEEDPWRR